MIWKIKFLLLIILGFIGAYYLGAMFNFFPFVGELLYCEIAYCSLLVSIVIVICTFVKNSNGD